MADRDEPRSTGQPSVLEPLGDQPSRTDQVVRSLTLAILRGEMQPGDRLVERDIAKALSVSKTPVREAIMYLVQRGLAVTSSFRGAEVFAPDADFARQLYEVRLLIEPIAVGLAVPCQTRESLESARAALDAAGAAASSSDLAELSVANRGFHRALYGACPNAILRSMADDLQDRVALVTVSGWRVRSSWKEEFREHSAILAAVEKGKQEQARDLTRAHIEKFLEQLV